ncbi:MAG: peptide chain release factor N(5)-glutamine methyltransferase [Clostridia bacterium]|nr:peptide chain release factor N(5)-glutamine methyltransferase [Clostridia bacterium]
MKLWQARNCIKENLTSISGDEAAMEAGIMLSHVTGLDALELLMQAERELLPAELNTIELMVKRRLDNEPIQYILGEWELMGLTFKTDKCALIPRQDTETVIEAALKLSEKHVYRTALDICCGTGCIGISLARYGGLDVTLADISRECVALAAENAKLLGVDVNMLCSDMFSEIAGKFDIIVCNPPYIRTHDISLLKPELSFEPRLALDGGEDGLDFYRVLADGFEERLNRGGALVLEIGYDQAKSVSDLLLKRNNGLYIEVLRDLSGNERCIIAKP